MTVFDDRREIRTALERAEAAIRELEQALQGPWAQYPGRTYTEWYYTVPAEAVEAFRQALEER